MRLIGYVDGINFGDSFVNAAIRKIDDEIVNIKYSEKGLLEINELYIFDVELVDDTKKHYTLNDFKLAYNELSMNDLELYLKHFYKSCPIEISKIKKSIEEYISKIENENIKKLTDRIYNNHLKQFYLFPAATRFHHAYVGGLAYHTYGMLELSESFLKRYSVLNKDLIYSGIILHDIAKTLEFTKAYHQEYTLEGTLIGHVIMGTIMIDNEAKALNIDSEEVLLLKHIVLSHHGQYQFGSPKKPLIAEALIISCLDSIDSKMTVVEEELKTTKIKEFTSSIGVLEKSKVYKHSLTKE